MLFNKIKYIKIDEKAKIKNMKLFDNTEMIDSLCQKIIVPTLS
ncbi:conserved hypothetical protein [Aliarcobacter butzleri JV22]|nr:conserved hypothetical protein [Aliarcobacter butzleri JV22]